MSSRAGLFHDRGGQKLVIADQIAPHVNLIFASPTQYDGPTLLLVRGLYRATLL